MIEGEYVVSVNQFARRETSGDGYTVQIEHNGVVYEFEEKKNPRGTDEVVRFTYSKKDGFKINKQGKDLAPVTKEKWNLKTNQFHRVKNFMLSPNYWGDNATGNKHYIFTLEDCISDEEPRSFFNEFLNQELMEKNKRVFEVLGGKLRIPKSSSQLSGVGFSDTQRDSVILRVNGVFSKVIKVII